MPDTSLIGLTLAGFRITGVIGEGGMATVYRGLSGEKDDEVAVKIMNPDLAKESRFVRRFRREAKAAAMLKHPNTVQILEFGVDQGYVFLAMELLRGHDLAMLLHRERRIPDYRAVQIVIQVCRALSAAHQQSIVHRDLKPDNIMLVRVPSDAEQVVVGLGPSDFVKVLDFGIAKILDDEGGERGGDPRAEPITQEKSMLTRVGTIVGTPAYMAPEQGRAEPVDARTDIYACGVLLYELITGRVPFTGETPMQVVMRHVNEPARPPSDHGPINAELERLIMRALAKYPSERQQSAEEMAFELLALLPKVLPRTADEHDVKKTLVIETGPVPEKAIPTNRAVPAPRPAAGAPARPNPPPAPRPAAGAGLEAAEATKPTNPNPLHFAGDAASPFPTLNIEVPDDIFPQGLGAPSTTGAPTSTDPAPTRRMDPAAGAAPATRAAAAGRPAPPPPAAGRAAPAVPLVVPGAERAGLMQTMQSHVEEKAPPSAPSDDDEAATVIKAPNEVDRARMSLAEEAMAKALGQPPPAPAVGQGLPTFTDPESVEPTLIAAGGSSAERGSSPPTAPAALAHERTEISGLNLARPDVDNSLDQPLDLKALDATMPLDPEAFEKVKARALARASAPQIGSPPPRVSADLRSDLDMGAPIRKPTSELMPLNLPEEAVAAPAAKAGEPPLVWEPKGRKLTGATALVVGIAIGAVLVVIGLTIMLLLRGGTGG